jgi:hypothetical protein
MQLFGPVMNLIARFAQGEVSVPASTNYTHKRTRAVLYGSGKALCSHVSVLRDRTKPDLQGDWQDTRFSLNHSLTRSTIGYQTTRGVASDASYISVALSE